MPIFTTITVINSWCIRESNAFFLQEVKEENSGGSHGPWTFSAGRMWHDNSIFGNKAPWSGKTQNFRILIPLGLGDWPCLIKQAKLLFQADFGGSCIASAYMLTHSKKGIAIPLISHLSFPRHVHCSMQAYSHWNSALCYCGPAVWRLSHL